MVLNGIYNRLTCGADDFLGLLGCRNALTCVFLGFSELLGILTLDTPVLKETLDRILL